MNEKMKNEAIEAIDRIIAHPISFIFRQPFPADKAPQEYFDKLKQPSDLNMVKKRLQEGQITTVQQWFDEMETVWSNAEILTTKDKNYSVIISENRKLFNKERKKLNGMNIGQWCGHVYEMRTEITDLMNQPPSKIKQFTDTLGAARSTKPNQQKMNERDLQNFIKATEMLTSDEDQKELIRIVTEQQPDLDTGNNEIFIDVSKLNPTTLSLIKDYIKQSLEKNGKKYPEN